MLGNYKILVVDDEEFVRGFCCALLSMEGLTAQPAASGQEALGWLAQKPFELILLDLSMPDMDGLTLLAEVNRHYKQVSPIVMTAYATLEATIQAQDLGVEGFLLKPFDDQKLLKLIARVMERRTLRQDYARLQAHVPLLALGHRLMAEPNLGKLAQAALEIIQQELKVTSAALWLYQAKVLNMAMQIPANLELLAAIGAPLPPPPIVTTAHWLALEATGQPTDNLATAQNLHFLLQTEEAPTGWLSLAHAQPGQFADRDLEFLTVISSHLTVGLENRHLYQAIDLARHEWESIFNTIHDGILVHGAGPNPIITQANETLANWLHLEMSELIGQSAHHLQMDAEGHAVCDLTCKQPDGQIMAEPIEFSSPPWAYNRTFRLRTFPLYNRQQLVEVVHVLEDITQATKMQVQMMQAEKLAALGRLSASMAHEINNPLQALRSGLRLLNRPKLAEDKRQQYVTMLTKEVERLISITTQTLDFSRPSRVGKEATHLNQLIQETLGLVNKQLQKHKIMPIFELEADLPIIQVVPEQIKQVFLNLILNAIDAMPEGGQLTFSTCYSAVDNFVVAAITDTGVGIPPEIWERISEPFFTTKEAGTGLGLTISYSIIEAHGGHIELTAATSGGCRFLIYLPVNLME